jgi:hypothetical protein
MSIKQDLRDLKALVHERGFQVVTLIAESEGDAGGVNKEAKAKTIYKSYDSKGIRTTIQLDSDCIIMMSPEVLTMPRLWEQHAVEVKEKLGILERISSLLGNLGFWLLLVLSLVPLAYTWDKLADRSLIAVSAIPAIIIALFRRQLLSLLRKLLLRPVFWAIGRYSRRSFRR